MIKSPYKTLYKTESFGSIGEVGIRIDVASSSLPNLEFESLQIEAMRAHDLVREEITAIVKANDPNEQRRAEDTRRAILSVFPEHIYVEEIPNGYCSLACCRHLPWFIVTTRVGHFEIGERKRVISIDWTKTKGTKDAKDLFPKEGVTKSGKSIHAWTLEDAKRYVATVIESASVLA